VRLRWHYKVAALVVLATVGLLVAVALARTVRNGRRIDNLPLPSAGPAGPAGPRGAKGSPGQPGASVGGATRIVVGTAPPAATPAPPRPPSPTPPRPTPSRPPKPSSSPTPTCLLPLLPVCP